MYFGQSSEVCVKRSFFLPFFLCVCALLSLGKVPLFAQNDLFLNELTAQNGLTDASIVFVYKDSRGFSWIGTLSALYRFDGSELVAYTHSKGINAPYLQSSMFEDKNGNLWFCAYNKLFCYERIRDTCLSFGGFEEKNGAESLEDYSLIHLEQQNQLWLTAGARIFKLDLAQTLKKRKLVFKEYGTRGAKIEGKKFYPLLNAAQELEGFIEYFLLDNGMKIWVKKGSTELESATYFSAKKGATKVLQIFQIQNFPSSTSKVLLSSTEGLWLFDVQKRKIENFFLMPQDIRLSHAIYTHADLLLCSTSNGLYYLHAHTKRFIKTVDRSANLNSSIITQKNLRDLFLDRDGIIWASAFDEGICYTHPNLIKAQFTALDFRPDCWEELPDQSYLFGTPTGLYHFKENKQQRLLTERINLIRKDHAQKKFWILSAKNVYIYDFVQKTLTKVLRENGFNWSFLQSSEGTYWVSSDQEVKKLDLSKQKKASINARIDGIKGSRIIWEDTSFQKVYLHENTSKLIILTFKNGDWVLENSISITGDIGQFLVPKGSDKIWVATFQGIKLIHRTKGTIENLTLPPFWPNYNITDIVQDENGVIWVSSNSHILSFDSKGTPLQMYTRQDGFWAAPFRTEGLQLLSNHKIGVLGRFGFNIFEATILDQKNQLPKIQLTHLSIQGKPYAHHFPLDTNICEKKRIRIKYSQNSIAMRIVGIELSQQKSVKVQYYLSNWEKIGDASTRSQVAELRYNKLAPGKYVLKVRAANSQGEWTNWQNKIHIEVIPPFWRRWWFIGLEIVAGILIVAGLAQWYYRAQLREARIRNEEQERILRDIHDLTSGKVVFFQDFQNFAEQEIPNDQAKVKALGIAEEALLLFKRISAAVRNNVESDSTLVEFLHQLIAESKKSVANHLLFTTRLDSSIPYIWVAGFYKNHLRLVVQEAIGNVLKHARASSILFNVNIKENKLLLVIQDDGQGIPEQQINQIKATGRIQDAGNGLGSMLSRMKSIGGDIKWVNIGGTQVIISVSLVKIRPKRKSFFNFTRFLLLKN